MEDKKIERTTKNAPAAKGLAMLPKRRPLTFIPSFLPDQTLYSWVVMFHYLSGNASEEFTNAQLFGSGEAGWHFHLPSHLDNFCASTQRILGEPDALIWKATILPAYLWFRPESITQEVVKRVRAQTTAGVPQLLRISRAEVTTFAPRRSCRLCIAEDIAEFGIAYWHLAHQMPGALVCPRHREPLCVTPPSIRNKRRRHFFSPEEDMRIATTAVDIGAADNTLSMLGHLAELSASIASMATPGNFSCEAMRSACIASLNERSLYRDDPAQCLVIASCDFKEHYRPIDGIPELQAAISHRALQLLWALLARKAHSGYPLDYLLLIGWLFGNHEEFLRRYADEGSNDAAYSFR